jgi:hypothetical protein
MSLKDEIERHRLARAAGGNITSSGNGSAASEKREASAAPPPFLRLIRRDKHCWLLPWACFQGVGYEPEAATGGDTGGHERLRLVFMSHDVSVRGQPGYFSSSRAAASSLASIQPSKPCAMPWQAG